MIFLYFRWRFGKGVEIYTVSLREKRRCPGIWPPARISSGGRPDMCDRPPESDFKCTNTCVVHVPAGAQKGTSARKRSNIFGFLRTYLYLCSAK